MRTWLQIFAQLGGTEIMNTKQYKEQHTLENTFLTKSFIIQFPLYYFYGLTQDSRNYIDAKHITVLH